MTALVKTIAKFEVRAWDGDRISMPGIYSGIPLDAYHAGDICIEPSVSSSGLRKLYSPLPWVKASPAHFWATSPLNPEYEEDTEEETEWMVLGRAAHHLLFAEKDFRKEFVLRPLTINGESWHANKTICKLWLDKQREAGLTVITPNQLKVIKGIGRELAKDPLIRQGLLNGLIEHSWFWKHPTGTWLKMRPDATPRDSLDYVDLKLTRSVMWPDLQRTIRDYGYFMQAGLTAMGVRAITGQNLNSYTLVFAENKEPHCIEIVTLKDGDIARGIFACNHAIEVFNRCWMEKRWPGPRGDREDAQYIEMNEFDQKRIDETIALDRKG